MPPRQAGMGRLVLVEKAALDSGSHGSFAIDFSWARISPVACVKFGKDYWHETGPEGRNQTAFLRKCPNVQCV